MKIIQLYKKIVPEQFRKRVASIPFVQKRRNIQLVKDGECMAEAFRSHNPGDGKIHVALMENRRAFWLNHASIYAAMQADEDFDVRVFAVPKRSPAGDMDWDEYRKLIDFFWREGIPCTHAYDFNAGTWANPLNFGVPDIVFLSQPFDFQQNFMYGSEYWSHFSKVAFLNYSYAVDKWPFLFRSPCLEHCSFIFCENTVSKGLFELYSPIQHNKLVVTGHPMLDSYLHSSSVHRRIPHKSPATRYRITWAPHFTVAPDRTEAHFSNFFEYYETFILLANEHPELEIIMRPHPALFKFMVDSGMKTVQEAQEYRVRFEALPNGFIYEDADYIALFCQSDAVLLDSIGFIAASGPSGKPVCFLESSKRERLNSLGERLLHAYYVAWDTEEIREFVERVVLRRDDYKKEEREAAVKKLLYMPPEGAGTRIAREIKSRLLAERNEETTHVQQ